MNSTVALLQITPFANNQNRNLEKGLASFRDITAGKAGHFRAQVGWDFATGVGSNLGLGGK